MEARRGSGEVLVDHGRVCGLVFFLFFFGLRYDYDEHLIVGLIWLVR